MTENPVGTLSLDGAVERLMGEARADDEPEELEAEPEADEGQPDDAETDAEDGDTEDAGESDEEPEFEVETVGGKQKVSLSKLKEGFMLKADYTRKTMAAAEERRVAERVQAEAAQMKQQLSEALQVWAVPTEQAPDWPALAKSLPPQQYNAAKAAWEDRQGKAKEAREHYHALREQQQQEAVQSEFGKLVEAVPEWRDQAKFQEAAKKIQAAGVEYGFSQEEIASVVDHRMVRVLHEAALYRELMKGKPAVDKKVAAAPTKLKPSAPITKATAEAADRQKLKARLRQTGSIDDAVRLLMRG